MPPHGFRILYTDDTSVTFATRERLKEFIESVYWPRTDISNRFAAISNYIVRIVPMQALSAVVQELDDLAGNRHRRMFSYDSIIIHAY